VAGIIVKQGDKIQLNAQLDDGDTGKFIRANLYDENETEITGSPFVLTHVGRGLYTNDAVDMPDSVVIFATYTIYDDAGFVTESSIHARSIDVFSNAADIGVAGSGGGGCVITGTVSDGDISC
jgi:hypothetical protein